MRAGNETARGPKHPPTISVVICTYNRSQSLRQILSSLVKMEVPGDLSWEVIVVDNNSSDDTRDVVREFASAYPLDIRYLFEGKQGLSNARNKGLEAAAGDIVAYLDDDVIVDGNWLSAVQKAFNDSACMGMGGRIKLHLTHSKPDWLQESGPYAVAGVLGAFDRGQEARAIRIPPFGGNMAFRKAAFQGHGKFRPDLGLAGSSRMLGEDTEFCTRLITAGEKVVYSPDAVVYHAVDEKRLTKRYLRSRYLYVGRSLACYKPLKVPLWRYAIHVVKVWVLAEALALWYLLRGKPAEALHGQCEARQAAGFFIQHWQMKRGKVH